MAVRRGHGVDDGVDGGEVRVARVRRRRPDRDEEQPRVLERVGDVRREVQATAMVLHQLGEAGLPDGDVAPLEALDLLRVDVDAPDVVAELREACRGDQADVARADDADGFAFASHGAKESSRCAITAAAATRDGDHLRIRELAGQRVGDPVDGLRRLPGHDAELRPS
jgi:hypothetical protein